MDIRAALRLAVDSGKVLFGERAALRAALKGEAAAIIIAANAPQQAKEEILHNCAISRVQCYVVPFKSHDLGAICGRPHFVAFATIIDPGDSPILDIIAGKKEEREEKQEER